MKHPLRRPNAETRRAMRDAKRGRGIIKFKDKTSLYRSLGLLDLCATSFLPAGMLDSVPRPCSPPRVKIREGFIYG